MASPMQLVANRLNAQKSTGPRSDAGKAVACKNALTHGLTAQDSPVLPGEDARAYEQFRQAVVRDLNPKGILQRELADDIAQTRWKIRRIPKIEAELMRQQQSQMQEAHQRAVRRGAIKPDVLPATTPIEILAGAFCYEDNAYARLELYRMRLTRAMHTSLRELRKLREETSGVEPSGVEPSGEEPSGEETSGEETSGVEPSGVEPSGEEENAAGDTGLRPVREVQPRSEDVISEPHNQHGPEARVTGKVAGKNEANFAVNPCPEKDKDALSAARPCPVSIRT